MHHQYSDDIKRKKQKLRLSNEYGSRNREQSIILMSFSLSNAAEISCQSQQDETMLAAPTRFVNASGSEGMFHDTESIFHFQGVFV